MRRRTSPNGNAIFGSVGLTEFRPVAGLTEFGTAKIALDVYPNEITNSLTSLADVHTEKYLRKNLILKALLRDYSMDRFSNVDPPTLKAPIKFGDYLAADFLAPGVWLLCPVDSDEWMKQPAGFDEWVIGKSLDFYFRELPGVSTHPLPELREGIESKKRQLGIGGYRAEDWDDLRAITEILKFFHRFPGRTW